MSAAADETTSLQPDAALVEEGSIATAPGAQPDAPRGSKGAAASRDGNRPQHCSATEAACRGPDVLSVKQERMIGSYAELTGQPTPQGLRSFSPAQADRWLGQQWELWRSMGHPTN